MVQCPRPVAVAQKQHKLPHDRSALDSLATMDNPVYGRFQAQVQSCTVGFMSRSGKGHRRHRSMLTCRLPESNCNLALHSPHCTSFFSLLPLTVNMSPKYVELAVPQFGQLPCAGTCMHVSVCTRVVFNSECSHDLCNRPRC